MSTRVLQTIHQIESDSDLIQIRFEICDLRIKSELIKFDSVQIESNLNDL